MLNINSLDFIIFSPILVTLYLIIKSYFLHSTFQYGKKSYIKDFLRGKKKRMSHKTSSSVLVNFNLNISFLLFFFFYSFRSFECLSCSQHLYLSNKNYSILIFLFLLSIFIHFILNIFVSLNYRSLCGEYLLSISGISLYAPFIILSNTLLTLFFFLELSVSLILYNFLSTWSIINIKKVGQSYNKLESRSRSFFNLIFFQFWSSFFSAALILYAIINYYLLFGTTEWSFLNFLISVSINNNNSIVITNIFFYNIVLILGFLIKLGLAPFFVYKLEIYKSLPLPTLTLYSIFYFSIFVISLFIFSSYFFNLSLIFSKIFLMPLIISVLLISLIIFDSQSLRNFFAISSILTSSNLFILLLS